jgi:hypothetical protein
MPKTPFFVHFDAKLGVVGRQDCFRVVDNPPGTDRLAL